LLIFLEKEWKVSVFKFLEKKELLELGRGGIEEATHGFSVLDAFCKCFSIKVLQYQNRVFLRITSK